MDGANTFLLVWALIQGVAFLAAAILFALFFARHEGKSTGYAIGVTIAAVLVIASASFVSGILFQGLVAFAAFYVADNKNRSRVAWGLTAILLGSLVLLVLLLLPDRPKEGGLQDSLTGSR